MTIETKKILELIIPLSIVCVVLLVKKLGADKQYGRAWWNFAEANVILAGLTGLAVIVWVLNVVKPEPIYSTSLIRSAGFHEYGSISSKYISVPGLIAALAIFFTWFFFLQRLELSKHRKKQQLFFALTCVLAFPLLITAVYALLHNQFNYLNEANALADVENAIIGVGLIEESIKLVPIILLLLFTKIIRHPIDFIIYGSLAGLSFSFVENLLYFNGSAGISSMSSRAIWCTLTHMFNTCIITYSFMLAKHKWHKNPWVWMIPSLFLASIAHGLFDWFQINIHFNTFWLGPFLILVSSIAIYVSMINNALNNSPYQLYYRKINMSKLACILCAGLIGIITLKFAMVTLLYGNQAGNHSLGDSLLDGWYLLIFLTLHIRNIDVMEKHWEQLKFFSSINPLILFLSKKTNYGKYTGMKIVFNGARKDSHTLDFLPLKGNVRSRHVISGYSGWLLVELEKEILFRNEKHRFLLMRNRKKNAPLLPHHNIPVGIFILPDKDFLKKEEPLEEQLILLDWVLMN